MLTSENGRENLSSIATVIIDEIHVLAGSKRGSLFMTNLERLEELRKAISTQELHRVAISATVKPIEEVAAFLGGFSDGGRPRPVEIIQSRETKGCDIEIRLGPPDHSSWWDRQIPLIASEIERHKCTLIFCNSRRASERASHLLNEHFGEKRVFCHHGSLSREYRYWVEQELKNGRLSAVTATSSLELGIDIGSIDRVLLIQTPFTMSAAIQRIGRSMHQVDQNSSAALLPLHPRDILRAMVQANAVKNGDIEPINIPQNCLDILAQLIISESAGRRIPLPRLRALLKRSWTFHHLPDADFDRVLEMLAGRYEESRIRELQPRILIHGGEPAVLEGREGNRFLVYQSGGTIPDRGYFDMRISGSEEKIGELDEEFVFERSLNEHFTLGNRVWRIDQIDNQKVLVSPGKKSSVFAPFWKADLLGMDPYSSEQGNCLLEKIQEAGNDLRLSEISPFLDEESSRELLRWLQNQRAASGTELPHRRHLLVEQLTDPAITPDTIHFIVHSNWGASVNAALMFCLQAKFKQSEGVTLQALYTDEAAIFSLPLEYDGFDILQGIHPHELRDLLGGQLAGTGLFGSRFRMNAARALLVLRRGFNLRTPLWLQRMKSLELLEKVLTFKDFPIVQETWRELLEQELSIRQLQHYLTEIENQFIKVSQIQTRTPTPFAADILWQLNNEYLYRDDSLESAQGMSPSAEILSRLIRETDQLPEIPEGLQAEYLLKRRHLMEEYQPESDEQLRFYFQDRRIFTEEERKELFNCLSSELPVQEIMDAAFYSSAVHGRPLWFNKDITAQTTKDLELVKYLALEWFDWQTMVNYEQAATLWGRQTIDSLIEEGQIILWNNNCIEKQVLERLLRIRRSWAQRERKQVSRAGLQYRSALLNNIRRYSVQGSRPVEGGDEEAGLERLSGTALPPKAFTHGLFPARLGQVTENAVEGWFHRSTMVWTGLGKNRIIIAPDQELGQYIRRAEKPPVFIWRGPVSTGRRALQLPTASCESGQNS